MSKIAVENVNVPGSVTNVDAAKYMAMRDAMMAVMTSDPMTAKVIAKGKLTRHATKPLSWSLG